MATRKHPATDGGWGWVVLLAHTVVMSVYAEQMSSFGLIFGQFLKDHQINTQGFTQAMTLIVATSSFTGLMSNYFIKRWGIQTTGFVCILIYVGGSFATIFVNKFWQLLLFNCFIPSIGRGMMLVVTDTSFNNYWVKKRSFAMALAKLLLGIVSMLVPLLIEYLLSTYGFRGSLLIIAGLLCHLFPSVASLKPIDNPAQQPKAIYEIKPMISQGLEEKKNNTILAQITKIFDLTLLSDYITLNLLVSMSILLTCQTLFITIQPIYLMSIGLSRADAAYCLTASAFADLLGRLLLTIIGCFYKFNNRNVLLFGIIGTVLIQLVYDLRTDFLSVLVLSGGQGFMKAFFRVTTILVISDQVSRDRFPAALGLFTFFNGIIMISLSPIISIFRDRTGSYGLIFYIISGIQLVIGFEWTIEKYLVKRNTENT